MISSCSLHSVLHVGSFLAMHGTSMLIVQFVHCKAMGTLSYLCVFDWVLLSSQWRSVFVGYC